MILGLRQHGLKRLTIILIGTDIRRNDELMVVHHHLRIETPSNGALSCLHQTGIRIRWRMTRLGGRINSRAGIPGVVGLGIRLKTPANLFR